MILPEKPADRRDFVHKRIFGAAKGFVTGGASGALGGFLSSGGRSRSRQRRGAAIARPHVAPRGGRSLSRPVVRAPGGRAIAQRLFPGGATGLMVAGAAAGNGCPQGFHPNKSDYFTKAGFVEQGTKCVKNRRRNLSNGRANTRSLRRMAAWDKQERKLGKTMKAIARGR